MRNKQSFIVVVTSKVLTELVYLLPRLRQSATCSYRKLLESNPNPYSYVFWDQLYACLTIDAFPSGSPTAFS
jgi:hypothetical protein